MTQSHSDAEAALAGFIARFEPDIAAEATATLDALRQRLPGAEVMVYDNYNYLAVGFGPDAKVSNIVLSVAVYPRWMNLFFMQGVGLEDPDGLLKGDGAKVRHLRLDEAAGLDDPKVTALIDRALDRSWTPFPPDGGRVTIKSVSAKQRPRRP